VKYSSDCIRCLKCTDACPARAIAFSMRQKRNVSLNADAAGRARQVSLKRRQLSAFDLTITGLWIVVTLFFTFTARQGAPQELKVTMAAGLLLVIYGVVWLMQKGGIVSGEKDERLCEILPQNCLDKILAAQLVEPTVPERKTHAHRQRRVGFAAKVLSIRPPLSVCYSAWRHSCIQTERNFKLWAAMKSEERTRMTWTKASLIVMTVSLVSLATSFVMLMQRLVLAFPLTPYTVYFYAVVILLPPTVTLALCARARPTGSCTSIVLLLVCLSILLCFYLVIVGPVIDLLFNITTIECQAPLASGLVIHQDCVCKYQYVSGSGNRNCSLDGYTFLPIHRLTIQPR
jgi:ferredoxin